MTERKLKIVITPKADMGETSVGIISTDRKEACSIVERWMLNSKYSDEIVADCEYTLTLYNYHEGETMDFVLTKEGELIEGEHWETK